MIALLADDLTGAAEVAGVCLRYGLKTAFGVNEVPASVLGASDAVGGVTSSTPYDACVVATNSRSMTTEAAVRLHRELAQTIQTLNPTCLFKKTDSVIRGHVLDELTPLCEVFQANRVLLQPANPAVGRCISEGRYHVNGRPLHESSFADDPEYPAHTDDVSALLTSRAEHPVNLPVWVGAVHLDRPGIHIPDAPTVEALKVGLTVGGHGQKTLLAGSAAFLAACFEACLNLRVQQVAFRLDPLQGRYLMVCGSQHAQSRNLVETAKRKGTAVAELPEPFMRPTINEDDLFTWADGQVEFWNLTGQMILFLPDKPVRFPDGTAVLTQRLASLLGRMLEQCRVDELVVVGGATAWAILMHQQWHRMTPMDELAPGVVRMHIDGTPRFLTLKPGSYLWPDDLDT